MALCAETISTGLRPSAQGWRALVPTLGYRERIINRNAVAVMTGLFGKQVMVGHNPVIIIAVVTKGIFATVRDEEVL